MMTNNALICENEQRRRDVTKSEFYGLDYLEICDNQKTLQVYFLGKAPPWLKAEKGKDVKEGEGVKEIPLPISQVRIQGGRRITNLKVTSLTLYRYESLTQDDFMELNLTCPGDFSVYTLSLVRLEEGKPVPNTNIDPRYASVTFNFSLKESPSDLDCKHTLICPPKQYDLPEINYLAKDYASFRQLILDRLALTMPDWQERHIPDIGITLVELLAYVGDQLSYYQDAVGTEAYLDMARQRISVRRHARLIDYKMHEGCNARAWVSIETDEDINELDDRNFYFITAYRDPRLKKNPLLTEEELDKTLPAGKYEIFEPLLEATLYFRLGDFKDLAVLVTKLCTSDPHSLSRYLWGQLSADLQAKLLQHQEKDSLPHNLGQSLVIELNLLLEDITLATEAFLAGVTSDECKQDWRDLQGEDLLHCNRLLLEAAYPDEIWSTHQVKFYAAHSEIHFYTWGDRECCLPQGATTATLKGQWAFTRPASSAANKPDENIAKQKKPDTEQITRNHASPPSPILHLQVGDILIFEENKGPKTGNPADADPTHRHVVRLTRVEPGLDALYQQPIVEIAWTQADALPFSLCISAIVPNLACAYLDNISVARGNVLLVDHGYRLDAEDLGTVPAKTTLRPCLGANQPGGETIVPARFRPYLQKNPLVFSQPLPVNAPATGLLKQEPRQALPWVQLTNSTSPTTWHPRYDLLNCGPNEPCFVAELHNEGRVQLRFGNGELGQMPPAKSHFTATYRVGGGSTGNVGAKAISHLILRPNFTFNKSIQRVSNPFPARGGMNPEPIAKVKQFASHAFRQKLQRAITADDYAYLATQHPQIQRATAKLRWTGSYYELLVVIDPWGQVGASQTLLAEITDYLYPYRRMGHDVRVEAAQYVPLDISITICVKPTYLRGHVKAALLERLSNRTLPNDERGFFHPDNLTLGEGVPLSRLMAAIQTVPGVASSQVNRFKPLFEEQNKENSKLNKGILPLGPLQVARLDNDPNFLENGQLELIMEGGR